MSGRGILNVVKVLNDAIKHMRKDFIPIYGVSCFNLNPRREYRPHSY